MKVSMYGWYDKVDKVYMPDSVMLARSERAVCRGYITAFMNDKKMNPAEYELVKYFDFDDETGKITDIQDPPLRIDPRQVYADANTTDGAVHDE